MLKVSVIGLKGGVGKTSVTLGLAGAATVRGLATLVVDLDPQGNATSILATETPTATVADVIARPTVATLESALTACEWEVAPGEVDVLPADSGLVVHDAYKPGQFTPRLVKALEFLEGYDLVLFDCPPSHGSLVREALAASDVAVVVSTPSYFGSQGVDRAVETIHSAQREINPNLQFGGIIVNRVRTVVEEHGYRTQELIEVHGTRSVVQPFIPERVAIQQAESHGQPVQTISTQGAREVRDIFDKHLDRLLKTYAK